MTVRVYVPSSLGDLGRFVEEGGIGPSPVHAHAVTGWLRESWPEASEEEWEYAALMAAGDDSVALLSASRARHERPRRVVIVAEVAGVTEDRESTAVSVDTAIALRLVQAVHADSEDIDPSVPEALGDLGWFAVQEIAALLA
jgi:hypothetical protein